MRFIKRKKTIMTPPRKTFVTLAQVAEKAGVSPGAASVAIRGGVRNCSIGVSDDVVKRVKKVAAEMGYRPSATARAMCNRTTRQIGVVLPNRPNHAVTSPMTFETILGINTGLQKADNLLVLVRLHDLLDTPHGVSEVDHGSRVFREDALDGVIVVGALPKDVVAWIETQFAKRVWCDTNVWEKTGCVRRDEFAAGYMACDRILASRFERLVWLGNRVNPEHHFSADERRRGADERCREAGIAPETVTIEMLEEMSLASLKHCNIIAESYPLAQRAWNLFTTKKIVPGKELSLVCCDDPHDTSWTWPELSRVKFDRFAMGEIAAGLMLKTTAGQHPKSKLLTPEWIPGNTIAME